jgi:hypothetical protein
MAKITIGRLPNATEEYDRTQFDTLIRELEQVITRNISKELVPWLIHFYQRH